MQALTKLKSLAEYAVDVWKTKNTPVTISVNTYGIEIRVVYRKPKIQLLQLTHIITYEAFDAIPIQGHTERIDNMVREVHLKYIQVMNAERDKVIYNTTE